MSIRKLWFVAGGVSLLALYSFESCLSSERNRRSDPSLFSAAPGPPIPDNDPNNHKECQKDLSLNSLRVVQLHITASHRKTFLQNVADGTLDCKDCLTYHDASSSGDDDNGQSLGPLQYASNFPNDLWPTPLDIDLYKNKVVLWRPLHGPFRPILIKIILEDTTAQFYTPYKMPLDSRWAVVAGGAHTSMFLCRGPVVVAGTIVKGKAVPFDYVTVKAQWMQPSPDHLGIFAGLNIGLVTRSGTSHVPVYVDPNVKSNG